MYKWKSNLSGNIQISLERNIIWIAAARSKFQIKHLWFFFLPTSRREFIIFNHSARSRPTIFIFVVDLSGHEYNSNIHKQSKLLLIYLLFIYRHFFQGYVYIIVKRTALHIKCVCILFDTCCLLKIMKDDEGKKTTIKSHNNMRLHNVSQ